MGNCSERQKRVSVARYRRVGEWTIYSRELNRPETTAAVVLIHGFIVSSRYMSPLIDSLGGQISVAAPDLPGWGLSEKPPDGRSLPIAAMVDVLAAWLRVAGFSRPVLLGNSFGCQIVTHFAARYSDLLSGAVLLGPTVDRHAHSIIRQAARLARDVPRERPSLLPVELHDLWDKGIPRVLRELHVMMEDHIEDTLPAVTVPTLVVRGSRDPIAPQEWVDEVAALLPRGTSLTLEGAPHCANYSAPEQLTAAILPFITHCVGAPLPS